jgi:hypothetical protein
MIIHVVAANRSVELEDAHNFRAFAIRIEGTLASPADAAELLKAFTVGVDGDHAWVSEPALREWQGLAGEAWWQEGLTKMIGAAQRFGWVDLNAHAIRAHIEYAP